MKTPRNTPYCLMYASFFIYSLSGIFSKQASKYEIFSIQYILYFCGIILILCIYALLWQQVLKKVPLSIAMANKPIVLIFSFIWAIVLFKEAISVKTLIGGIFICLGVFVIGKTDRELKDEI